MLGLAWPVDVELGDRCGRIEERTLRRREPLRGITDPNWATVLAMVGERIVWWLSAAVRSQMSTEVRRSGTRCGLHKVRILTDSGGGWSWSRLPQACLLDRRDNLLSAKVFFVDADGISVQALAEGPAVTANRQTLRNRELGQLCQTQKWLKRYKTGMFANLANVFSPNRPAAGQLPIAARSLPVRLARLEPRIDCRRDCSAVGVNLSLRLDKRSGLPLDSINTRKRMRKGRGAEVCREVCYNARF